MTPDQMSRKELQSERDRLLMATGPLLTDEQRDRLEAINLELRTRNAARLEAINSGR